MFPSDVHIVTLIMSFGDKITKLFVCHVYTGGNVVEIKTEADCTDFAEWPYDDKPSTGVFGFFSDSKCV